MKVRMHNGSAISTAEYQPICDRMLRWLKERNIPHLKWADDWHSMPTSIEFLDSEDATLFKLTFSL